MAIEPEPVPQPRPGIKLDHKRKKVVPHSAIPRPRLGCSLEREETEEDDAVCMTHLHALISRLSGDATDLKKLTQTVERLLKQNIFSASSILLRILPYSDYLKTHHWASVRKAALEKAAYRCQVCNASDCELHVHHRTYDEVGEERENDVTVLCKDCHSLYHHKQETPLT